VSGRVKNAIGNALLVLASVAFVFIGMEVYLRVDALFPASVAPLPPPNVPPVPLASGGTVPADIVAAANARYRYTTMPQQWQHRDVAFPGALEAYYWQGVLHVVDPNTGIGRCRNIRQITQAAPECREAGFRRSTPFPPKDSNVFRVMVVGDSLTYGVGIREESTFTALLNKWLSKNYRIEILNLGVSGYQSEDVLHVIQTWLPILRPDLVIYAVCLNDFLPSGIGEYNGNQYAFPLPGRVKRFFIAHTLTGAFLNDKYDAALRGLHLRRDFFDDILADFAGYEKRFARDVAEMNHSVMAAGVPPMFALVLDQYPAYRGRGYRITRVAEDALRKAGADVIPTETYYRLYDGNTPPDYGQRFYVSSWEGHPNEVANYIWAKMIYQQLIQRKDMAAFRR
jgi:hypothetical protein